MMPSLFFNYNTASYVKCGIDQCRKAWQFNGINYYCLSWINVVNNLRPSGITATPQVQDLLQSYLLVSIGIISSIWMLRVSC